PPKLAKTPPGSATPPPSGTAPPTSPAGPTPASTGKSQSLFLQVGDRILVRPPAVFTFSYGGNRYKIPHATLTLKCRSLRIGHTTASPTRVLAVDLKSGEVRVQSGRHVRRALVLSPEMLAFATVQDSHFVVDRNASASLTSAYTFDQLIVTADARIPKLRINTRASYTALATRGGIRLNIWQFGLSPLQRPTT